MGSKLSSEYLIFPELLNVFYIALKNHASCHSQLPSVTIEIFLAIIFGHHGPSSPHHAFGDSVEFSPVVVTASHVFEHLFTNVTSGLGRVVKVSVMSDCIAFSSESVAAVQAEKQAAIFGYPLWWLRF